MGFLDYFVAEDAYLALAKVQGGLAIGSVSGKTFWVDSTHVSKQDISSGGQLNAPFATLAYAISQAGGARGDTIILAPNHAEDIASDGAINLSKDGLTVRGLGWGTFRPQFTLKTATTASFKITGNGGRLINVRLRNEIASCDRMLEINANGVVVAGCLFYPSAAANHCDKAIECDGGDVVSLLENEILFLLATSAQSHGIHLAGGMDYARILANTIMGNFSVGGIVHDGGATDLLIEGNRVMNLNIGAGTWINVGAATGTLAHNIGLSGHVTHDAALTGTAVAKCENYAVTNLAYAESGGIIPTTRST